MNKKINDITSAEFWYHARIGLLNSLYGKIENGKIVDCQQVLELKKQRKVK